MEPFSRKFWKSSILLFLIVFCNFRKIGDINENDTYIIPLNVLRTIQQQNIIKKLESFFLTLKISDRLHVKYPQKLKYRFQISGALTLVKNYGKYQFWRNSVTGLGASVDHRRTFCRQSILQYQEETEHEFWLHSQDRGFSSKFSNRF